MGTQDRLEEPGSALPSTAAGEAVTFINCFEVPAGRDDEFLVLWTQVNEHMRRQPGYLHHRLHRSLSPAARFRFVNVARWASVAQWEAAHDEGFRRLIAQPGWVDFPSSPSLFEIHSEGSAAAGNGDQPVPHLLVEQQVKDPEKWRATFTAGTAARQAAGGGPALLLRDPLAPGHVVALVPFRSADAARDWRRRPGVDQQLADAGVVPDTVQVRVLEELLDERNGGAGR